MFRLTTKTQHSEMLSDAKRGQVPMDAAEPLRLYSSGGSVLTTVVSGRWVDCGQREFDN
jgi:hypothetical protein